MKEFVGETGPLVDGDARGDLWLGGGHPAQSAVSEIKQGTKRYCAPVSGESNRSQPGPAADIRLPAAVDAAHENLSGPGVRRILQREFTVFGKPEFENLAAISAWHIYNLRQSKTYAGVRVHLTQARQVSRRTAEAGSTGAARLPAGGHGASRSPGWPARGVPHQRSRYGDAMAGGGLRRDHLRVSVWHAGFSRATTDRTSSITEWPRCGTSC